MIISKSRQELRDSARTGGRGAAGEEIVRRLCYHAKPFRGSGGSPGKKPEEIPDTEDKGGYMTMKSDERTSREAGEIDLLGNAGNLPSAGAGQSDFASPPPASPESVMKPVSRKSVITPARESFALESLVKKHSASLRNPGVFVPGKPRSSAEADSGEPDVRDSDLVSAAGAARFLEISDATVRNWVKQGRLLPAETAGRTLRFRMKDLRELREDLANDSESLTRRRNKTRKTGRETYGSYITRNSVNIASVNTVASLLGMYSEGLSLPEIRTVLADAAVKMLHSRGLSRCPDLGDWFRRGGLEKICPLILDLVPDLRTAREFRAACPAIFDLPYEYEPGEDALGFLYLSIMNIGDRKSSGAYYTPAHAVKRLIAGLPEDCLNGEGAVLDPCAGAGNFLLNLPESVPAERVYGADIDETAVLLLRINMALRYRITAAAFLKEHFAKADFLRQHPARKYRVILGNPPWGYRYSAEERQYLREHFRCVSGNVAESFALFLECSFRHLAPGGFLSFIVPEAALNVKIHAPVREFIMERSSIRYLAALGDIFPGVQCPSVILGLENTGKPLDTAGMRVETPGESFVIRESRPVSREEFSFLMNDARSRVLERLESCPGALRLLGHADFALGIVTGDNRRLIHSVPRQDSEPVLSGAMIFRYGFRPRDKHIVFRPEEFQQCARTEYYRAPEKLIYRFISRELAFAYDDKKTLSLNSANILIPGIPGLSVKYVMAVLNSRMAQFYFALKFNSLKVLRSHIEAIPLPPAAPAVQEEIAALGDRLSAASRTSPEEARTLYESIDGRIAALYGLSEEEYRTIREQLPDPLLLPPPEGKGEPRKQEGGPAAPVLRRPPGRKAKANSAEKAAGTEVQAEA